MGLNSEIHYERLPCGAETCENMPRLSWDSEGWKTRALESLASAMVGGLLREWVSRSAALQNTALDEH